MQFQFVLALLLTLPATAAEDEILRKLEAMQAAPLAGEPYQPTYVVHDRWRDDHKPRTIFAVLSTDSEGYGELVAFRVDKHLSFRRLASYGTDVRKVELRDVTGDGNREILVSRSPGNRSVPIDILRWDGQDFDEVGETNSDASYVDLDLDGVPEIVEFARDKENECGGVTGTTYVQKLTKGVFVENTPPRLVDIFTYTKMTNGPETVGTQWFLANNQPTRCRLRIVNGTKAHAHRVTSISIRLRGVDDVRGKRAGRRVPLRLTADDEHVDTVVNLPSRCSVAWMTLRGPAGAVVTAVLKTTGKGDR